MLKLRKAFGLSIILLLILFMAPFVLAATEVTILPTSTSVFAGQSLDIIITPGTYGVSPKAYIEKDGVKIVSWIGEEALCDDLVCGCEDPSKCTEEEKIKITLDIPKDDPETEEQEGWDGIYYFKYTDGDGSPQSRPITVFPLPPPADDGGKSASGVSTVNLADKYIYYNCMFASSFDCKKEGKCPDVCNSDNCKDSIEDNDKCYEYLKNPSTASFLSNYPFSIGAELEEKTLELGFLGLSSLDWSNIFTVIAIVVCVVVVAYVAVGFMTGIWALGSAAGPGTGIFAALAGTSGTLGIGALAWTSLIVGGLIGGLLLAPALNLNTVFYDDCECIYTEDFGGDCDDPKYASWTGTLVTEDSKITNTIVYWDSFNGEETLESSALSLTALSTSTISCGYEGTNKAAIKVGEDYSLSVERVSKRNYVLDYWDLSTESNLKKIAEIAGLADNVKISDSLMISLKSVGAGGTEGQETIFVDEAETDYKFLMEEAVQGVDSYIAKTFDELIYIDGKTYSLEVRYERKSDGNIGPPESVRLKFEAPKEIEPCTDADGCTKDGDKKCISGGADNDYKICGDYNDDGCFELGVATQSCGANQICSGNACVACTECSTLGAKTCDSNILKQCGNWDSDSCYDWGNDVNCSESGEDCYFDGSNYVCG